MLPFRYVRQTRYSVCPIPLPILYSTTAFSGSERASSGFSSYYFRPTSSFSSSSPRPISLPENDLVSSFKDWFRATRNPLYDGIFRILRTQEGPVADATLCRLNLQLSESLVLDVLKYGKSEKEVLACLRFFDWAGRQGGFYHTRATFHAMFKILSRKKLMWLMLKFLDKYVQKSYVHQVRYYDTLVIGYSVAGKLETALHVFGRMRFSGVDLDQFAYHVLLNSLVEHSHFDVADMILNQIQLRGLVNDATHSIVLKLFCKQNKLDMAEQYLNSLIADSGNGKVGSKGVLIGNLVDDFCKYKQFQKANNLVDVARTLGIVPMQQAYGVWIGNLIKAGNLDGAFEFIRSKKEDDGYVPDIYRYNMLVYSLLNQNRLEDMLDLMMEMIQQGILPNEITMSAILCFFCKVGMVDPALELYNFSTEFGISLNRMSYNYLMQALFSNMNSNEPYDLMEAALKEGYYPGKRIIYFMDKNIQALCQSGRLETGWYIYNLLKSLKMKVRKDTYFRLIRGLYKEGRGDIASNLFMEMQLKGHKPSPELFRAVVRNLCEMDGAEDLYFRLLQEQLSLYESCPAIYNCFIDAAGHAKKPELAKQVYDMMLNSEIEPNLKSDILLFQSYLKNYKIVDALNFFDDLSKRRVVRRKLWNPVIIGLCKVGEIDLALKKFWEMRADNQNPSMESYEELVKALCGDRKYLMAFKIIDDLQNIGRPISSFIGNIILLHSLTSREIYHEWINFANSQNVRPGTLKLGKLIHSFINSMKGEEDVRNLEELIRQCFPPDLYTHNLLLRRLCITTMSYAYEYFKKFPEKGFEPNRWTYNIVVQGLKRFGWVHEADQLMEEVLSKQNFNLTKPRIPYTWGSVGILRDQT